jgi:hypothetical protein
MAATYEAMTLPAPRFLWGGERGGGHAAGKRVKRNRKE